MHVWSWLNSGTNHFNQADFCLPEMKKPTILSNKSDTALSCVEHQIFVGFLRINSSEQDFKYLYWTISKILFWDLFTWKGIYMIDWVGRIRLHLYSSHTQLEPANGSHHMALLKWWSVHTFECQEHRCWDCEYQFAYRVYNFMYGVATISRLLKIVGLFCRISFLL